jgi:hypothetical protein
LSRDRSIVLELEFFSWQVYEAITYMLLYLSICPYKDHFTILKKNIVYNTIDSFSCAANRRSYYPLCLFATIKISLKFEALKRKVYSEII